MLGLVKSCIGTKFTSQFGDLIAVSIFFLTKFFELIFFFVLLYWKYLSWMFILAMVILEMLNNGLAVLLMGRVAHSNVTILEVVICLVSLNQIQYFCTKT